MRPRARLRLGSEILTSMRRRKRLRLRGDIAAFVRWRDRLRARREILTFVDEDRGRTAGQGVLGVDSPRTWAGNREDRLIGFTWELAEGPVYHFLFMGVDYRQSTETDLYFNLVYEAMDHAFRSDSRVIHVGQTADGFKSLLGCSGNRRYIYARGVGPTLSWILRRASGLLFPPRLDLAPHDVFKPNVAARGSKQLCATDQ